MPDFVYVNLVSSLKIKPEKAIHCLKIPLGNFVEKGTVLAENKSLFSGKKVIIAPIAGLLDSIEEITGILKIKPLGTVKPIDKPIENKKTTIQSKVILALKGCGKAEGKFIYMAAELRLKDLTDTFRDKIIGVNKIYGRGVVYKAAALGVKGIVTTDNQQAWLNEMITSATAGICLLILSAKENLNKLNHQQVICDGEKRQLIIL